uniref:Non-haem dioxygenase N-terminal domain-containing protein n=1 Tax=Solanum lycopersicum TaxID=4081 RepID=A0A3Q7FMA1_SOLLC
MSISKVEQSYDRMSELKLFDDTKAGVKGLVDSGIAKGGKCETNFTFLVVDLQGIDEDPIKHKEIVDKVRDASETWGFFQVVNHGIPTSVINKMLQGTRQFFEQDNKVKKQYYTRDIGRKVFYNSNIDLYRPSVPTASWKDAFFCFITPNPPGPQEFPTPCWEILMDYSKDVTKLGFSLLELLNEGFGLVVI